MEFSSTSWIRDITDRSYQQEETHSKYTDLSHVARDIFSITTHGVEVGATLSFGWDLIGQRQLKTTCENLRENVIGMQFTQHNNRTLAGDNPTLDMTTTENNMEIKRVAEERKLHRMAKVHNFLEMWQCSQNLHPTWKESWTQSTQTTAVGYISDTESMFQASWSNIEHDGASEYQ